MKCPTCGENTPDMWHRLVVGPRYSEGSADRYELPDPYPEIRKESFPSTIHFDWMVCASKECGQVVVRGHNTYTKHDAHGLPIQETFTWFVYPRHRVRSISPLVPGEMARDFQEAAAILDVSHRMSAVLARRILADVLERYAGLDQFSLTARIDAFVADTSRPRELRRNLHYLREIADFSAHTQTSDQLELVDIDREEAEWTLDVVERLFDYFIVGPERDRKLREGMDAKIEKAKRKPIPLPPDLEVVSEGENDEVPGETEPADREDSEGP